MNIQDLSDEQLVEVIRSHNQELYSHIIRRYQNKLSHYLRKFIFNPDELQDVLQIVFIKTFKNLFAFKTDKKFSSWIYRITHNEALNYLKKYHFKNKVNLDDIEYKLIDEEFNIEDKIDRAILKNKIEQALGQIKFKYREPLILFYFEHKSYEEISDILRLSQNTVGTLIHRGKKYLKENLVGII